MFEFLTDDPVKTLTYIGAIIGVFVSIPILKRVKRQRGQRWYYHVIFLVVAILVLLLVPEKIQGVLFSEGGVLVFGTLLPVYESILAVCSIGEEDDTAWLQYWVAAGSFTYATEFMDVLADKIPFLHEHWYEFEFFSMLWLLLPWTDGSGFLYDKITKKYIAPQAQKLKKKFDGWGGIILTAVNSAHLWMIWFTFMSMPEPARRFVTVAVGTVYPLLASTVAITTESTTMDDTYWLTYWSCFSLLFIAMDYLETFVGSIRGFYTLCLCATAYLFLPMFRGAEAVFRKILVPLSGQYENMLLRDTYLVRCEMEKKIPEAMHESVLGKAAEVFSKPKKA